MKKEILKQCAKQFRDDYYNIADDMQKNQINIRIGGRGLGKSFSAYRFLIDDFLRYGNKFVLIRRQQTDIESLLTDIACYYDNKISYEHHKQACITDIFIDDNLCGYMISLSCGIKYKSHNFLCDNILFDEFIKTPTERKIAKDEYIVFFEILETIIRDRTNVTVLMLSNAVTSYNDYFLQWRILVGDLQPNEMHVINDVTNLIMLPSTHEYMERKKQTLTYKSSVGTGYHDYAYNNIFSTGFLNAYVREYKSHVLPSKNDFYFKFGRKYYQINSTHIRDINFVDIPSKSPIYYRGLTELEGNRFKQNEMLYLELCDRYLYKILDKKLYFNSIDTAVALQDIFFINIETGGLF